MISILKSVWRLAPVGFRTRLARVRLAWAGVPMFSTPTYADDGLISQHVVDFLKAPDFIKAYNEGKATRALKLHPGDIHFRAYIACWAGKHALSLEGDFVECGVGKGLLSKTIVSYLNFNNTNKKFYLFDTYEGIPVEDSQNSTEEKNMQHLNEIHFNNNYFEEVQDSFSNYANVELIQGRIPESFEGTNIENVSYLSIDMNNAKAEISTIEHFWDRIVPGGITLLDDYAYSEEFRAQKNAWDFFAKSKNIEILTLPTGQGLIIKK